MTPPVAPKSKPVPKVALIGIERPAAELLRSTFLQFKIESHVLTTDPAEAMHKKKYEGCVVRLDDQAGPVLEAVRTSARNRQITILGLCHNHEEAIRYSKFGINAVLKLPLDRQETMKAVRSTHLLILHELRRYVRLPIVLEVVMETSTGVKINGMTRDISYGGMSVKVPTKVGPDTAMEIRFTLPSGDAVKMPANVLWFHPPELVGLRFESTDEPRQMVRRWIDAYLEIA
ncbi:MAG: PilZ domain-containing protein [Acidobacteriia bacterium]|nr:PilZ domain-containing protein [Terriglobia bacterium]